MPFPFLREPEAPAVEVRRDDSLSNRRRFRGRVDHRRSPDSIFTTMGSSGSESVRSLSDDVTEIAGDAERLRGKADDADSKTEIGGKAGSGSTVVVRSRTDRVSSSFVTTGDELRR
jgi:hypothetical protein